VVQFYDGTNWQLLNASSDSRPWGNITICPLPATADDNPDFAIRFALVNASVRENEYAFLDNVIVTGEFDERCAVPLFTPIGLVALVGMLSIVATSTLVRKRRR